MNKGRVEAFSDGVFAIAITLLVITIAQPAHYDKLAHDLFDQWPSLAAYVVSFIVIGIMWLNHHTIFSHLQTIDRGGFYLNLILLMTIVFIPYPTGVFGEALRKAHDLGAQPGYSNAATTAAAFYSATMTINALAWVALWLYASTGRRLLQAGFPESQRVMSTVLFAIGPLFYAAAIGLAFVNPYLCLSFHAALALYYALDPISRRVGREQAGLTK
ncbi:MAG TPA: TMEM175 family protein [Acidimicrobiales bacterium]|nr:TMEM175 family protein [Acidimicrobiales bacterium]